MRSSRAVSSLMGVSGMREYSSSAILPILSAPFLNAASRWFWYEQVGKYYLLALFPLDFAGTELRYAFTVSAGLMSFTMDSSIRRLKSTPSWFGTVNSTVPAA